MRYSTVFVIAVILTVALATEVDDAASLPPANFAGGRVKVFDNNKDLANALPNKKAVVCFFNANCGHCKDFAPEFIKASEKAPKEVEFYAIDAQLHGDIPAGFQFKYFPAVFWVDNQGNRVAYTDSRNAFSLVKFVKGAAGAPASLIEGVNIVDHYNSFQTAREHPTDCKRELPSETPILIESQSAASTAVEAAPRDITRHVLDASAYDGNEADMHDREAEFLKQWTSTPLVEHEHSEEPVFVAAQAVTMPTDVSKEDMHAEAEADEHHIAEASLEADMDMEHDSDLGHGHALAELEAETDEMY